MIALNVLLDILICHYTAFYTYFFLTNIFYFPKRYFIIIILLAIFIDMNITHTLLFNLIFLSFIYISEKILIKRRLKIISNILINSFNLILYIVSLYLIFNFKNPDFIYLIKVIAYIYPVHLIYYLISYKIIKDA